MIFTSIKDRFDGIKLFLGLNSCEVGALSLALQGGGPVVEALIGLVHLELLGTDSDIEALGQRVKDGGHVLDMTWVSWLVDPLLWVT